MITLKTFLTDENAVSSKINSIVEITEKPEGSKLFMKIGPDGTHAIFRDSKCKNVLNPEIEVYFMEPCRFLMGIDNIVLREFANSTIALWYTGSVGFVNKTKDIKNNLIVRYIDSNNKIKDDFAALKHIADTLDMDVIEPVFSNYLTEYQKNEIKKYVESAGTHTDEDFKAFMLSLVGISSESKKLYKFGDQTIGYVFKFIEPDGTSDRCVIESPFYSRMQHCKMRFDQTSYVSNNLVIISYLIYISSKLDEIKKKIKEGDLESLSDINKFIITAFVKENKESLRNFNVVYNKSVNLEDPDKILKLDDDVCEIFKKYNIDKTVINILVPIISKKVKNNSEFITDEISNMQDNIINTIAEYMKLKKKEDKLDDYEQEIKDKLKKINDLKDKLNKSIKEIDDKKEELADDKKDLEKKEKDKNKEKEEEEHGKKSDDSDKDEKDKDKKKNESFEFYTFDRFKKYILESHKI